jgi:hypothetical protein
MAEPEMWLRTSIAAAGAVWLTGCTTINIHGSNRVQVVRHVGIAWSIDVEASEPVLIERISIGLDATLHEVVLGFRQSQSVYRPVTSNCQVLIVVDRRSDAEEAINTLRRSIRAADGFACILRK